MHGAVVDPRFGRFYSFSIPIDGAKEVIRLLRLPDQLYRKYEGSVYHRINRFRCWDA